MVLGWMHEDPNDVRKMTALGTGGGTEVCVSMDVSTEGWLGAWMDTRRWTDASVDAEMFVRVRETGKDAWKRGWGGVGTGTAGRGAGRVRASGRQVPAWERAPVHGRRTPTADGDGVDGRLDEWSTFSPRVLVSRSRDPRHCYMTLSQGGCRAGAKGPQASPAAVAGGHTQGARKPQCGLL